MKKILIFGLISIFTIACKKNITIEKQQVIDNVIYELNPQVIYQSSTEKTKQKSSQQYLSILYANLFQTAIPQDDLAELTNIRKANGEKAVIDEIIINSFINDTNVIIPTDAEMRADIQTFIEATYIRFYLRLPTAYEVFYLKNQIESDTDLTPKLIYTSFALSNEYKYY